MTTIARTATVREADSVSLSGVHIIETDPPEGGDAVQWHLLTSLWINTIEAAVEVVFFYLQHWRIEDFFRVLKSGCQVEYLAFHTAGRLRCPSYVYWP